MGTFTVIKDLEKKVRLSKPYYDWVHRNKSANCLWCGTDSKLECHHVIELYHIILGLWKLYGDADKVFNHALSLHEHDKCESVTLCNTCHTKPHPGRTVPGRQEIRVESWTVLPRNIRLSLGHSTRKQPNSIGLIGFQALLGIGWYIMNGHLDSRIVEFNIRRFAEVVGKTPGTSFNNSFENALRDLHRLNIVIASHIHRNEVELHVSVDYLNLLGSNPWFMSVNDIKANRMCVLALKWWLGMQSNRKHYKIGLTKLMGHIGITTKSPSVAMKAIATACKEIPWATVDISNRMCNFEIKRKGSTPIFSLRQTLDDSLHHGM